jgi:ABC-type multidrug transport system fused ATPase/permease subunit
MYEGLTVARIDFFQSTPLGRILNRFSKDVGDLDKNVAPILGMTLSVFMGLLSTLGVLAGTAYYTVAAWPPLLFGFYYLQAYYRSSSRELKRMDAVSRSPIYAHFQQVQQGIDTVSAFGKTELVVHQSSALVDNHIRFNLAQMSTNRWLGIRLEFFGGALVLVTALFVVEARSVLTAGIAGLALSTALQVTGALGGIVRLGAMLENSLNSVERVAEYANVGNEHTSEGWILQKVPKNWPCQGRIELVNMCASYMQGRIRVLKNITLTIHAGQKVGVIGRTGAGKSSLAMTLFRMLDIDQGRVLIDGVDIRTIDLTVLRRSIGIIPQEPLVFEGSLRDNIDPFRVYSDEAVGTALRAAHLPLGMDEILVAGGKNLSAGQRQQVCLARVLLRRPKILVLDEATSALDAVTDRLVGETIREQFGRSATVITIAHRLHTIVDSDLIIALDSGEVMETGSPRDLLRERPNGLFASLIRETGSGTSKVLVDQILGKTNL